MIQLVTRSFLLLLILCEGKLVNFGLIRWCHLGILRTVLGIFY